MQSVGGAHNDGTEYLFCVNHSVSLYIIYARFMESKALQRLENSVSHTVTILITFLDAELIMSLPINVLKALHQEDFSVSNRLHWTCECCKH